MVAANRWLILAILFSVRVTMGFQFQAVAAVAPLMMDDLGIGLADIGFLIGLYLAPGIVMAYPGGALARRFGDRRVVLAGLLLMIAGGLFMVFGESWAAAVIGRLLAGVGAIFLNVTMAKMVADHFAGHEISTAMAIYVNSWPVGIALALVTLPGLAGLTDLDWAQGATVLAAAIGFLLMLYYPRDAGRGDAAPTASRLSGIELRGMVAAGSVWGLYNGGTTMVIGFGPTLLSERGFGLMHSSSVTSLVLWSAAATIPIGGYLADRLKLRDALIAVSLLSYAVLTGLVPLVEDPWYLFLAIGLIAGLAPGPIMGLPATLLRPQARAAGMGIFFTLYYVITVLAPILAGWMAEAAGGAAITFTFGAAMLAAGCLALAYYRGLEQRYCAAV